MPLEPEKKWLVFYTKSRHEKKAEEYLARRGYEVFLPLQKTIRQWSDRKKKVEVPLFNSYLFVCTSEDKIPAILQCPAIAWNIRYNDKPAILRSSEMEIINRFLHSGLFIETTSETSLAKGDRVEVLDGALKGLRGTVIQTSEGKKFSIALESIRHTMVVVVDAFLLKALD